MNVETTYNKLVQSANKSPFYSIPFILKTKNKIELAIFTYTSIEAASFDVELYKCTNIIKSDGENIEIQKLDQRIEIKHRRRNYIFESADRIFNDYMKALQKAVDDLEVYGKIKNIKNLRNTFKCLVVDGPSNEINLFRKICPSFLRLIRYI